MNPEVSVVIPTRNRPEAVVRAVESVLAQTIRDLEVTVVIDGPDKGTASSLAHVQARDGRLQVIELERNMGACTARNRAIEASKGRWIALLDDDDEWLPNKLEKQLAAVAGEDLELKQPIVATKLYARTGDGRRLEWPRTPPTEPLSEYLFCRKTWSYGDAVLQTSTLMAPRTLFLRVPFTNGLKKKQDYDWLLRAARESDAHVVFVDSPLAIWRIWYDEASVSNCSDWRFSRNWARAHMSMMTKRAFAAFLATDVAREARDQRAYGQFFPLLVEILWRGRPRLFDLALFLAAWVPAVARHWIDGLQRASVKALQHDEDADPIPESRSLARIIPCGQSCCVSAKQEMVNSVEDALRPTNQKPSECQTELVSEHSRMNPEVSVVIPTRNRPETVVRAVESVLAQTIPNLEVTVVIDGPDKATSSSLARVQERDTRLHVIELERNMGACAARNRGIEASKGRWIALLDDDDEWLPNKLEKQLAAVAGEDLELKQPIVATKLYALTGDGRRLEWPRTPPTEPLSEYLFCRKTWSYGDAVLQTSTLMAPRTLFLRVPFSENLRNYQDDDWLLRAVRESNTHLVLVRKPLVNWRIWYDHRSVSNHVNSRVSLSWIRGASSIVTRRAYAGFIAANVAREAKEEGAWGQAVPLFFEMLWRGKPRLFDLAVFVASWFPTDFRRYIASLVRS